MKFEKISELREISDEKLGVSLVEYSKKYMQLRSKKVFSEVKDLSLIKKTRRHIARIRTVINERVQNL